MITKATIIISSLITFLLGYNLGYQQYNDDFKQVSTNGVTFRWKLENGQMKCQVSAPTSGWVAVGFKPASGLVQSNLIMGAFRDGYSVCEDRYVVNLGEYPQVETLGGNSAIEYSEVTENNGRTEMHFAIPSTSSDGYHYNFEEGQSIFVTLAFSRSDDFTHHSAIRVQMELKV